MGIQTIHFPVIIIGGGASGLTAAIRASQSARVLVLEHHERAAEKILSTGNGRCNLTNSDLSPVHFRCADPAFPVPALTQMSLSVTLRFFRDTLHVFCRERDGYWYPRSNQAATVREALLAACTRNRVTVRTGEEVRSVKKEDALFQIVTDHARYTADACILCCGGKAFPKSGSDGSGYRLAKQLGHSISKPLPALTALYSGRTDLAVLSGVRANAKVSLYAEKDLLATNQGEVQFTDYGISGIPVFQVSRYAAIALHLKKQVTAVLDLMPELTEAEWETYLSKHLAGIDTKPKASLSVLLHGALHRKLAAFLLAETDFSRTDFLRETAHRTKSMAVPITKTASFQQAQTTTGGVRVSEIHPETMASRLTEGLFFAGEIIDIDGACGGYNLQWAWASGSLAGSGAAAYADKEG